MVRSKSSIGRAVSYSSHRALSTNTACGQVVFLAGVTLSVARDFMSSSVTNCPDPTGVRGSVGAAVSQSVEFCRFGCVVIVSLRRAAGGSVSQLQCV